MKDREEAIERFFSYMETHNGRRRTSPREFAEVKQARKTKGGAWEIFYNVPKRYLE